MKSPITGKQMTIIQSLTRVDYRKEKLEVVIQSYLCPDSKETFASPEMQDANIERIDNAYRAKVGIPFTDQIVETRNKYGLSAAKISEILGFGKNQYLSYEKGEMPSVSNGKTLSSIIDPNVFMKYAENSPGVLSENELKTLTHKIAELDSPTHCPENLKNIIIFGNAKRSIENGYAQQSIDKIKNIIIFFTSKKDLYVTPLNKFLFYADNLCFTRTGMGMSGLRYQANHYGPVPYKYSTVIDNIDGIAKEPVIFPNDCSGEKVIPKDTFDETFFSEIELNVLNDVYDKLKNFSTTQLVEYSHQEQEWIDHKYTLSIMNYSCIDIKRASKQ